MRLTLKSGCMAAIYAFKPSPMRAWQTGGVHAWFTFRQRQFLAEHRARYVRTLKRSLVHPLTRPDMETKPLHFLTGMLCWFALVKSFLPDERE
jgi:hypothetical protein